MFPELHNACGRCNNKQILVLLPHKVALRRYK